MRGRRRRWRPILALLCLGLSVSPFPASAGEKECVKQGLAAERAEHYPQAIERYQLCLQLFSQNIKASLSIYRKLLRVYQAQGQTREVERSISLLQQVYPTAAFDLHDFEQLARIYLDNQQEAEGLHILTRIVSEHAVRQRPEEIKVMLRSASKLLRHYKERGEREAQTHLLDHLKRLYPTQTFQIKDVYDLAILYLEYGDLEAGKALLHWIAYAPEAQDPDKKPLSKKALFLLGRKALAAQDCEAAIRHYLAYIERYPQNLFYVQYAYQRIVSCHWTMGRKELAEEELKQIADFVNGIADYRSQMNFARDLHWKGKRALAQATFASALALANQVIETKPGSYEAMKAHYEMERYGHAVGRYDVVERGASAIFSEFGTLRQQARDPELRSAIEHITSQSYLWLGKTRQDQGRHEETVSIYEEFLSQYPKHKDRDYISYELGRAYEALGQLDRAVPLYESVGDGAEGVWKRAAEKQLQGLINPDEPKGRP